MAGDTQPGLTARRRAGGGRRTRLMRTVFIEVDHRHGRVAVHTQPRLTRATARGWVGAESRVERAAFFNHSTDVGAVAVLPCRRSRGGSIVKSRGGGAQPISHQPESWHLGQGTADLAVSSTKSRGEVPRAFHQPENERISCVARPRALLNSGWYWYCFCFCVEFVQQQRFSRNDRRSAF